MHLVDLEPQFIRVGARHENGAVDLAHVATLEAAQGIRFDCPRGEGHWVVVWFADRGVPSELGPAWQVSGTGYGDLTISPSVDCTGVATGCKWHGCVTSGAVA